MSHDQLRALMEHGEETGCVNLSAGMPRRSDEVEAWIARIQDR